MRLAQTAVLLVAVGSSAACSDSDTDVRSGPPSTEATSPIVAEPGSGDRAYVLETTVDFVDAAEKIGLVEVTAIERDPNVVEVHNDELLQDRLVRATVIEPVDHLTQDEAIVFADGTYSRTRPSPEVEYGTEQLFLATEAAELAVGVQAIVGLRQDEVMGDAVFVVDDGTVVDTERSGDFFDAIEGRPVADAVADLRELTE